MAIVYNNKGVWLNDRGEYDKALPCFEQSLNFNPNDPMVLTNKQNTLNIKNSTGNNETIGCLIAVLIATALAGCANPPLWLITIGCIAGIIHIQSQTTKK